MREEVNYLQHFIQIFSAVHHAVASFAKITTRLDELEWFAIS
jgi:hypothetical protein